MRKTHAKLYILALLLLLVVVALFVCLYHTTLTAHADGPQQFTIVGTYDETTGFEWTLYVDSAERMSMSGDFVHHDGSDDPALLFANDIRDILTDRGHALDDYVLTFVMPTPIIRFDEDENGATIDSNPYTTEEDSNIIINTEYHANLGSTSTVVEYKPRGASDDAYTIFPAINTGTIRFGNSVDIGEYEVRVKITEEFSYLGKVYNPVSASAPLECYITNQDLPDRLFSIPNIQPITYGATRGEIANAVSALDINGTWTLVSGNPDEVLDAQDHVLVMNFQHKNTNYNPRLNVNVPVTVAKREITVVVQTIDILQGKPIVPAADFNWHVKGDFAGDDTPASIGIYIDTSEVNPNEPGTYNIYARALDANYELTTTDSDFSPARHGYYIVHQNNETEQADDFREINVMRPDGFIGIDIHIERLGGLEIDFSREPFSKIAEKIEGMTAIVAYTLVFSDENGACRNLGEITITLQRYPDDYAVAYVENGEVKIVLLDDTMSFVLPNNVTTFVVLKQNAQAEIKTVEWNGALTAICVLIILLVAASWVVVVIYLSKRRLIGD